MPRENNIGKRRSCWRRQIALLFAFIALFAASLFGQTPQPSSVEDQIERVRKENEALREQIRKIEEQQKALQESIKPSQPADATKGEAPLSGSGSAGTETAVSPAPPEAVAAPAPCALAAASLPDQVHQRSPTSRAPLVREGKSLIPKPKSQNPKCQPQSPTL